HVVPVVAATVIGRVVAIAVLFLLADERPLLVELHLARLGGKKPPTRHGAAGHGPRPAGSSGRPCPWLRRSSCPSSGPRRPPRYGSRPRRLGLRASARRTGACPCVPRSGPCRSCSTAGGAAACRSACRRSGCPRHAGRSRSTRRSGSRSDSDPCAPALPGSWLFLLGDPACSATSGMVQNGRDTFNTERTPPKTWHPKNNIIGGHGTWLSASRCRPPARPAPRRWSRRPAPSCSSRRRR